MSFAVQPSLPLPRPDRRPRNVRRPFHPSPAPGRYRLPHDVRDRLGASLAPYRNRDAAYALAVFLARFWSTPSRITTPFPVDRRALADHPDLALTEAEVRGAIRTLEAVGFLDRAIASKGSGYKPTEDGLRRIPILFHFGSEYAPSFIAAIRRVAAAQKRHSQARRPTSTETTRRPSTALPATSLTSSPKRKTSEASKVLMGEIRTAPPEAKEPNPALEAALDRLEQGFRQGRGG
jgi:hypothetical protein